MLQKRRIIAIGIVIIAILISTFCVWPMMPLNSFRYAEVQAVPRFDALNKQLFATIPVPSGVVELDQSSNGIISLTTEHGRYLITNYQMFQTQPDVVLGQYDKFFLSNGWTVSVAYKDFYSYFRGTACVDILFYGDKYSLSIWYDFWKQDFSPANPNTWLLEFLEFGESSFALCPPFIQI